MVVLQHHHSFYTSSLWVYSFIVVWFTMQLISILSSLFFTGPAVYQHPIVDDLIGGPNGFANDL